MYLPLVIFRYIMLFMIGWLDANFYKDRLLFNKNLEQRSLDDYEFKLKVNLEDLRNIRMLQVGSRTRGDISIDLTYRRGISFTGNISTDSLQIDTHKFIENQMGFDFITKYSNPIEGKVLLSSKEQKWSSFPKTSDINISLTLFSDTLTGDLKIVQPSKNSSLILNTQSIFGRRK